MVEMDSDKKRKANKVIRVTEDVHELVYSEKGKKETYNEVVERVFKAFKQNKARLDLKWKILEGNVPDPSKRGE